MTPEIALSSPPADVLARVRKLWAPPTELTVSEFADTHIVVTSGPLAGTRWQTDFAPYQRGILDVFHEPGVQIAVVMGSSQWGKALAIDTPIPTASGWKPMADVAVGDALFDERGRRCKVIGVTDVQHDRRCFRLTFSDRTTLVADAEHRWLVESDTPLEHGTSWTGPGPRVGILTTEQIATSWQWFASKGRKPRHRYAIPVARPLVLPKRALPLDPYVLGMWLGDGHSESKSMLTLNLQDVDEILASFAAAGILAKKVSIKGGAVAVRMQPGVSTVLRSLGVVPKRIPSAYLRASIAQRRALLQGLMDSDGAVDADGDSCEFSTTSVALADGMRELLLSLGLKHTVREFIPVIQYLGESVSCALTWRFDFTAYADAELFRVTRKRQRLPSREGRRTSETERRRIVGVDPVPSVPVKCIAVNSPSRLYLAGRAMIPTHNTSCAVNIVAYHIAHDPCRILVVEPTVDPMAKDFSTNRLDPVVAATPILRDTVSKKRQKDQTNTTLQKTYKGGVLAIGGANSAASLAARDVRLLILDEVDRYPLELPGEGSTIAVAIKRTQTYRSRKRIAMFSSPTIVGGQIDTWYQKGDRREYFVPCPACGEFICYRWSYVRWENEDPITARIHCPMCDHGLTDGERLAVLTSGEWRPDEAAAAERLDPSIVSFHLWEAYSPFSSLAEIVRGFLSAREKQKTGDRAEMHTWQNTTLGEPIEPDTGDGVEPNMLLIRREVYGEGIDCPEGVCLLTMGVDTQDDRLEAVVWGWGPGEESWVIDRHTFPGNTEQPEPWKMLDELLDTQYQHAGGEKLAIAGTCIDSAGHRTTIVYDYALRQAARRVYAIIGRDGNRPIVSSPSPRRWGRQQRKVPLYTIGVDAAKSLLISRLAVTERGRGFVHLPMVEWCDDEFTQQLTSERLVTRKSKGVRIQEWKKVRTRNEALDCSVYAIAALRLLNPKLELLAQRMAESKPSSQPPTPPAPRGSWLSRRPGGSWLKRDR